MRQAKTGWLKRGLVVIMALVAVTAWALFNRPAPAEAHCDSTKGPVVLAAEAALEAGDVKLVLPYVKEAQEAELSSAFAQTLAVRGQGGEARNLADRYFFETAVRLHRQGEGAPYTGLKEDADFGPALHAAEGALETGDLEEVYDVLARAMRGGVAERYEHMLAARAEEAKKGTVEAARERVEAELGFETYIYGLYQAATGSDPHAEANTNHEAGR